MRERLVGVDATRGLALLGMAAVHVLPVRSSDGEPTLSYLIAGGRSAAAFAVLAGVGLALASGATSVPAHREHAGFSAGLLARAALIGLLGLAVGYPESRLAVILPYYALLFLLAIPLLVLRPRTLFAVAAACAVVVPVLSFLLRTQVARPERGNPVFADVLERPAALLVELSLTGYYPALAWVTYLAAGLAAGRLALGSARVATALLVGGGGLALAASGASTLLLHAFGGFEALQRATGATAVELEQRLETSFFGNVDTATWWWLAVESPHSSTPFDLLHTTGTALALLGSVLLLARLARRLLLPLAAAGSMTLTLYATHVVMVSTDLLPADREQSYLLQVAVALVVATAWRTWVGRGPAEAVVAAASGAVRDAVRR